jgi:hypothetical protein
MQETLGNRLAPPVMIQPGTFRKHRTHTPAIRRTTIVLGGFAASVFLHGLLLTPLLWGRHHQPQRAPNTQGASASQHEVKSLGSMMVIFLDDSRSIRDPSGDDDAQRTRFLLPQPPIQQIARPRISATDLNLTGDTDERTASEASGDQTGHSMLFGRYMGQISARVERAWVRPRSVPAEGSFACRVQITQDQHGNVQEVTLEKCTDDLRWQISLVRAITAASPLPAPPDPAVFSNLLTMEFDSDPYVAGTTGEGFEAVARAEVVPTPRPNLEESAATPISNLESGSTSKPGWITRKLRRDGSVDLTIIGSPAPSASQQ